MSIKNKFVSSDTDLKLIKFRDLPFVLLLILSILFVFIHFSNKTAGDSVIVEISGVKSYEFDRQADGIYPIKDMESNLLMNLIIENNTVHIEDSECPLKICEKHGKLAGVNDAIVCVPQEVIIRFSDITDGILNGNERENGSIKYDIITK